MNAVEWLQILQVLRRRRDAIAASWYQALTRDSLLLPATTEVRRHLAELTERIITLLPAEPFERDRARAVGADLAHSHYIQPETLATTQEVLASQLVEGLPAGQIVALQPRLAALLGELAAGFFEQARDTILVEQEQIHRALMAARARAEKRLRQREETVRALLNAHAGPALLIDANGAIVALNEAAVEGLGTPADELVGTFALDLLPPDVARRMNAQASRVFRAGKSVRLEYCRDGRWFDSSVYPVFDAQGKVGQVAVLALDITRRKRAEEALRVSEARYRSISELISSFAYSIGVEPDGTVVYEWVTEHFTRITGFAPGEVTARGGWPRVIHPDDVSVAVQHLRTLTSGQPDVSEFRIVSRRGEVRWLRDYGRPVWDEARRRVIRIYGAAQDITDRKQMEQRLLHAERLAATGRLAAALAHEVNNPLQAVRSNLELALDFDLEVDEREEYLHIVRQEIERLIELTRRVLNFAQPADDTRYRVHVAHLVQETLALLGRQLAQAHVQVTTDLPAALPPVFVAPKQILQVLVNLTINAIQAMPDGGHLDVVARVAGDVLALSLTNDGPSIPPEDVARIFEAFFTTKPEGTGLGLAISDSIVRRHGGAIRVENLAGDRGVTFVVTLPLARHVTLQETVV
jgi:two-component system sporulation sensor kinase A